MIFNSTTKRTNIRHLLKFLYGIEAIRNSYVVADSTPAVEEVLIGPISNSAVADITTPDQIRMDDAEEFTYVSLPFSRAPAIMKFTYSHLGAKFCEISTNIVY